MRKKAQKALKKKKAWKQSLEKKYGKDLSDNIWKDAEMKLSGMYETYADIPKGEHMHTDGNIFVSAAVYKALQEYDPENAFSFVEEMMKQEILQIAKYLKKMSKFSWFRKLFLSIWTPVTKTTFGPKQGFANTFYPAEKGEFRMDITRCPYHDYTMKLGCPEIGILFCRNDEYALGDLQGMKFERSETICGNGSRCDFHLLITKK